MIIEVNEVIAEFLVKNHSEKSATVDYNLTMKDYVEGLILKGLLKEKEYKEERENERTC